jgi:hypothetical protein
MRNIKDKIKIEQIKSISTKDKLAISDKLIDLFRMFNISALCLKNKMIKFKGYSVSDIISVLTLFPFMALATVNSFMLSRFRQLIDAQKDTFFRLKNNEYYNWRNLLFLFSKRFNKLNARHNDHHDQESSDEPKCLVLDDSLLRKVGMKIEFIGKVFDHVTQNWVLGFKLLLLAFWDGNSLIPLDFSYHAEQGKNKKYPFGLLKRQLNKRFSKKRSKDAAGYKRAQEVFVDKITNAIALIKRAVKHGFVVDYVLCDSWYSVEKLIKTVRQLKKGIIHFLGMVKMDKRLYDYQGQKLNAKELLKQLKPTHTKRAKKLNAYYIEVMVNYSDIGRVKLFLTRFSKRSKWRLILSTDLNLNFQQAMKIYNIRWTIEVLFKECKQHLNLGKCQSNDFDAQIADTTISLVVYMMLSFHKKIHSYTTLGALFAQYRDEFIEATVAEKLWQLFISLQFTIAEILEIDCTNIMRVIFQSPQVNDMFKSLSKLFFEDNCSTEFKKAA